MTSPKPTADELTEVRALHAKWRRGEDGGIRANLAGANLARANLAHADLAHADLAYANLAHANLPHADLAHANLAHAILARANLTGANLAHANLAHANLTGAILDRADLRNSTWEEVRGLASPIFDLQVGRHRAVATRDQLSIGCELHTWAEWFAQFAEIGEIAGYSPDEVVRYGAAIQFLAAQLGVSRGD